MGSTRTTWERDCAGWMRATLQELVRCTGELSCLPSAGDAGMIWRQGPPGDPARRVPLSVEVADTLTMIQIRARIGVQDARRQLRMGAEPDRVGVTNLVRTVARLRWLDGVTTRLWAEAPDWASWIHGILWPAHGRARRALGLDPQLVRVTRTCPRCGWPTLVADPLTWVASCPNTECVDATGARSQWTISEISENHEGNHDVVQGGRHIPVESESHSGR